MLLAGDQVKRMPATSENQGRVSGVNEGAPQEAHSVFFLYQKTKLKGGA